MRAITVTDPAGGVSAVTLGEVSYPHAAENDVIVQVYAAGFTPGELNWPSTWTDRAGRDRTPSVPGHEVSGVVTELGYGTTGLTVGQRVFGLTDWARDGTLAAYVAVEARNLAPLPTGITHTTAAALPISGLTAWQALFHHGMVQAGQTVLINGAAGGVGSIAVQLANQAGVYVIGTGRGHDRELVLELGADEFLDLQAGGLADTGPVDVVVDLIGGEVLQRSAALVRPGGTLVGVAEPPPMLPSLGRAMFFVVEPDRHRLAELAELVRTGRLRVRIGEVVALERAVGAFTRRTPGKTIIEVGEGRTGPARRNRLTILP